MMTGKFVFIKVSLIFEAFMKSLLSYLLSVSILFSSLGSTIVFMHYQCNKNYYARVLCENRNKPMMHCNGHCKLSRELKELEKKADAPFSPVKEKQETVQFFEMQPAFTVQHESEKQKYSVYYLLPILPEITFSVFHPPAVQA